MKIRGDSMPLWTDLMFIGSSRERVMEYIKTVSVDEDWVWCWYICDTIVDDPKCAPHNVIIIGKDGREYRSQREAWEICRQPSGPAMKP